MRLNIHTSVRYYILFLFQQVPETNTWEIGPTYFLQNRYHTFFLKLEGIYYGS